MAVVVNIDRSSKIMRLPTQSTFLTKKID